MPTRSIYLSADLDRAAREAGLDVTALAQRAIEGELARQHNVAVLAEMAEAEPLGDSDEHVARVFQEMRDSW